jgi:hypothetical protein
MGSSVKDQFAEGSLHFDKFGVITGSTSAVIMDDEPCSMVRFKADNDNSGAMLIGEAGSGLTSWPMEAGDDTGWVSTSNLDRYNHSSSSGTYNYLLYWLQK